MALGGIDLEFLQNTGHNTEVVSIFQKHFSFSILGGADLEFLQITGHNTGVVSIFRREMKKKFVFFPETSKIRSFCDNYLFVYKSDGLGAYASLDLSKIRFLKGLKYITHIKHENFSIAEFVFGISYKTTGSGCQNCKMQYSYQIVIVDFQGS